MKYDNSDDIIRKIINENTSISANGPLLGEKDIRNRLGSIDRNAAMAKLRQMGLGNIADKLKSVSDDDLINMIAKNPALLKKINSFLK
ncbi:MAG: hypothetical protein IKA95_03210 [Clostridia bacterium]|nr:hypothetical protein [Clostridia bacterium]